MMQCNRVRYWSSLICVWAVLAVVPVAAQGPEIEYESVYGEVVDIDPEVGEIAIYETELPDGEARTVRILVNDQTEYEEIAGLAELEPGWLVWVDVLIDAKGVYTAEYIAREEEAELFGN